MNEQLTERMKALIKLAHYSTEIQLTIPLEFIAEDVGFQFDFKKELQDSLTYLLEDGHNDTTYTSDEDTVKIHMKAKGKK